jgi:hypothetical protein
MRTFRSGVLALVTAVLLSACALVPSVDPDTLYVNTDQKANDRMQQIVDAVNSHDAAALKAMFSPRALEQATDIDEGLDYLFSLFANGGLTSNWQIKPAAERQYKNGKLTEVLLVEYNMSADGHVYSLFFADFTVNDVIDPDNVGLYALGVTPWPEGHQWWTLEAPSTEPFFTWVESIHADESDENGYPGVYVPGKQ